MKVFLAGPIDWWWQENWHTPEHDAYVTWRTDIKTQLVEAGHLVYLPHEAIKGAWDESMQAVNDKALEICEVFVYLTPLGVPAKGTEAETEKARALGKRVSWAPPGRAVEIDDLLVRLGDPYGDVQRKSKSCTHGGETRRIITRMVGGQAFGKVLCLKCSEVVLDNVSLMR